MMYVHIDGEMLLVGIFCLVHIAVIGYIAHVFAIYFAQAQGKKHH